MLMSIHCIVDSEIVDLNSNQTDAQQMLKVHVA
jgi:hypothetical protein